MRDRAADNDLHGCALQLINKLGMDGTERKSTLRLAGSSKVWSSRWEMLKEINTMAPIIPLYQRQKRKVKRTAPRDDGASANAERGDAKPAAAPSVADRMREWEEAKRAKVEERLRRQRELEAAALAALRFKPKAILSQVEVPVCTPLSLGSRTPDLDSSQL